VQDKFCCCKTYKMFAMVCVERNREGNKWAFVGMKDENQTWAHEGNPPFEDFIELWFIWTPCSQYRGNFSDNSSMEIWIIITLRHVKDHIYGTMTLPHTQQLINKTLFKRIFLNFNFFIKNYYFFIFKLF